MWTLLLAACFSHTLMWSVPSPTVALPIAGFMHQLQGFLPFSLMIFMVFCSLPFVFIVILYQSSIGVSSVFGAILTGNLCHSN